MGKGLPEGFWCGLGAGGLTVAAGLIGEVEVVEAAVASFTLVLISVLDLCWCVKNQWHFVGAA